MGVARGLWCSGLALGLWCRRMVFGARRVMRSLGCAFCNMCRLAVLLAGLLLFLACAAAAIRDFTAGACFRMGGFGSGRLCACRLRSTARLATVAAARALALAGRALGFRFILGFRAS